MKEQAALREAIATTLAVEEKAYALREACVRFGLEDGDDQEAWASKHRYVETRLKGKDLPALLTIGDAVLAEYEGYKMHAFRLKEALRLARANGKRRISEITRKNILDEAVLLGNLSGKLELDVFLRKLWPIDEMASHDPRFDTLGGEIWKHMVMNNDWSIEYLFDRLGVLELSDEALGQLLETIVHPSVRQDEEQGRWVDAINKHLDHDGFLLSEAERISGYPVFRLRPLDVGVAGVPKNLIFASTGPKPEIVLTDAIHNDLQVVKHAKYCLFFDEPIPDEGLCWHHLVAWWAKLQKLDANNRETERDLYRRLSQSLRSSPPEQLLFKTYYACFKNLGKRLPALVPQVYVHFDPKTVKELYGEKRLARQRMDFLILFSHGRRTVVEVDGAQHYSSDNRPDVAKYAAMVEADRQLKLCGYDVYRFGGAELQGGQGEEIVRVFFERLLKRHGVG